MSPPLVHLVVAFYEIEDTADATLKALKAEREEKWPGILELAVVRRDEKEKIHIKELGDTSGGRGAVIGGAIGAVLGLVAGPAGVVALGATGAWIGGLSAATTDTGIPNPTLDEIGMLLQPGTSAVVLIVADTASAAIEAHLLETGAQVVTDSVHADIAKNVGLEPADDEDESGD